MSDFFHGRLSPDGRRKLLLARHTSAHKHAWLMGGTSKVSGHGQHAAPARLGPSAGDGMMKGKAELSPAASCAK